MAQSTTIVTTMIVLFQKQIHPQTKITLSEYMFPISALTGSVGTRENCLKLIQLPSINLGLFCTCITSIRDDPHGIFGKNNPEMI
jgi:hypothetical protein